jgi:hypothetical protein
MSMSKLKRLMLIITISSTVNILLDVLEEYRIHSHNKDDSQQAGPKYKVCMHKGKPLHMTYCTVIFYCVSLNSY